MKPLVNKWALVTGSSRGIGQQIAIGLAEQGCNIIVHATESDHCSETFQQLNKFDIKKHLVAGKLGQLEDEKFIIDSVIKQVGHVDILYNNAAIMSPWHDKLFEFSMQEWKQVFEINLFAPIRLCNAFYPAMVDRRWGRIINLVTGMKDTPQLTPYSAAKAALEKFTYELSVELEPDNVFASALDPGWLKTDMGGQGADFEVETVLPGALVPALLNDNESSRKLFKAQEYRLV